MRIALFTGHNPLAQAFASGMTNSHWAPVAIFKPTFSNALPDGSGLLDVTTRQRPSVSAPNDAPSTKVPTVHAGALDATIQKQLHRYRIELIVSVCFPRRIPDALLRSVKFGGLNIHPSPLPAWRGVDPVFWQLRHGCSTIGLSLHEMTNVIDAGAVLAKTCIALDGIQSMSELDQQIARRGLDLLVNLLDTRQLSQGDENRSGTAIGRGHRFSAPCADDYRIWTRWHATHLRRFVGLLQTRRIAFQLRDRTKTQYFDGLFEADVHPVERRGVIDVADGRVELLRSAPVVGE